MFLILEPRDRAMRRHLPNLRKVTCGTAVTVATLALTGLLFFAPTSGWGEPAAKAPTAEQLRQTVEELVRELDAPTRARREAALARLKELGPQVLPILPAPDLLSAAAADAVKQLRGELERQKARTSIQASKVTLQGTRSLGEWIRELSKQSRNALDGSAIPPAMVNKAVKLDLNGVEFWKAWDRLGEAAGVSLSLTSGAKVQASETPVANAVVTTSGAFRVSADPAGMREIFGTTEKRLLRVPLKIQPEPRLRPLFLHYSAAEITAEVPRGASLPSLSPEAKYEVPLVEGGQEVSLSLDFVTPPTAPKEVSVQGKVWFTTAADQEPIRFNGLKTLRPGRGREVVRRRGGVSVALRKVALPAASGDRELHVEVTVTYDTGGPAFESHRTWIMHNSVYLEAPNGTRFALNGGTDTRLQTDGAVGIEYRFVDLPDPLPNYSFVYVAPTLIIDAPVEFRLNSIPVKKGP